MTKQNRVTREFEVFVILINDSFQTVRAEPDAAFEVRDNFQAAFEARGSKDTVSVVIGKLTYNPADVAVRP